MGFLQMQRLFNFSSDKKKKRKEEKPRNVSCLLVLLSAREIQSEYSSAEILLACNKVDLNV